jgi:hypothetical protein
MRGGQFRFEPDSPFGKLLQVHRPRNRSAGARGKLSSLALFVREIGHCDGVDIGVEPDIGLIDPQRKHEFLDVKIHWPWLSVGRKRCSSNHAAPLSFRVIPTNLQTATGAAEPLPATAGANCCGRAR